MGYQVVVTPGGQKFSAEADETLLDAMLRQGLSMPYGCRNGACGACRATITGGEFEHGAVQPHALSDDDKAKGTALLCCAKAKGDLTIEHRQVTSTRDIPVKTLPARVETMEKLAPDVMELTLRLPASERLQFLAGQYIDIQLKDGKKRSFSLANPPHEDTLLKLHIREVPGGLFTAGQVFSTMKPRDILRFSGPLGGFTLRDDSERPIILLAGGTGFAPIQSIVEHARHLGLKRPMHLYWGARAKADLYLDALAREWAQTVPGFTYTPVLSAPLAEDGWQGRTGLVHQAVLADFANLSGYEVYACGAPPMIDAARKDFTAQGMDDALFFSDAFTFNPA